MSDNFFWEECENWSYIGEPVCCYPCTTGNDASIPYKNTFWNVDVRDSFIVGILNVQDDTEFRNSSSGTGQLQCEQIRFSGVLNGSVITTTNDPITLKTRSF